MHGTVVCGVTDSAESRGAAQLAAALAARLGLRLVLVRVVDERLDGDDTLEAVARDVGGVAEIRVALGNRVDALAKVAAEEGADVIVLGSRARGHRLRCTLAQELEAATAVPVVIAPPASRGRSGRRLALVEAPARH